MLKDFYIDESGNTGDVASVKKEDYFNDQRIFSLAAIGLPDDITSLEKEVISLKKKFNLQGAELKSTAAYRQPKFILELLSLMKDQNYPIFAEIVDKHYFLVVNLVQWALIPPCELDPNSPELFSLRNKVVDYIACRISTHEENIAQLYADICLNPTKEKIISFYKKLSVLTGLTAYSNLHDSETNSFIMGMAQLHLSSIQGIDEEEAIESFIPPSDISKKGKNYWMLPNSSSLNNIYARINKYAYNRLNGVILNHDEQLQFDSILQDNKTKVETLIEKPNFNSSDYNFLEKATLKFVNSKTEIGIQLADIIAGFLARYIQEQLKPAPHIEPEKIKIFSLLNSMGEQTKGTGLNMLLPDGFIRYLSLTPSYNY